VLELQAVSRAFRGGGGVSEVSERLRLGEITALVGLNGAGKTTLMRLALGMLRPDSGAIRIDGRPVARATSETWRRVGHLVDTPLAYPELTSRESLQVATLLRGVGLDRVDAALAEWHLGRYSERRARRLSMGNRQRVGLAAALLHHPMLVILDEPTNALDPSGVLILNRRPDRPDERRATHRRAGTATCGRPWPGCSCWDF